MQTSARVLQTPQPIPPLHYYHYHHHDPYSGANDEREMAGQTPQTLPSRELRVLLHQLYSTKGWKERSLDLWAFLWAQASRSLSGLALSHFPRMWLFKELALSWLSGGHGKVSGCWVVKWTGSLRPPSHLDQAGQATSSTSMFSFLNYRHFLIGITA